MKEIIQALKVNLILIGITGFIFPLVVYLLAQLIFPYQANGSLIYSGNMAVGSEIIGQVFTSDKYFHSRPSAAGSGYDATNSSGTNLGPTSSKLFLGIKDDPTTADIDETYLGVSDLARMYREVNQLAPDAKVPVDAVTRSGSGLDPHISPANALLQAPRVAKARGISTDHIKKLINSSIEQRTLGFMGEPRVNVLVLNLKLDRLQQ